MDSRIERFLEAQASTYHIALDEIMKGRKRSHWMWFIFPQVAGLGISETSRFYGIKDLFEAKEYMDHPILGSRLKNITNALLKLHGKTAFDIFGSPDDLKLKSCMTLFSLLKSDPVFDKVLVQYFSGSKDVKTIQLLQ